MRTFSLGVSLALVIAAGCARAPVDVRKGATRDQAIINGATCDEATDPSAVGIIVDATVDFGDFGGVIDFTALLCTGTLIAPDVVLSAAHCVDPEGLTYGFGELQRADYWISFRSDLTTYAQQQEPGALELPQDAVPVASFVKNEEFHMNDFSGEVDGPGNYHDTSLLFLAGAVTQVRPELLITAEEAAQVATGTPVEIAGWGQQGTDPNNPGVVGLKQCGVAVIGDVGDHEIQVGGDSTTTRKCHGDSGGPTYLDVDSEHDVSRRVIGITSHAYDQSDCQKGGVDTRVDAWLDWIDDKMRAGCATGDRAWCGIAGVIPPSAFDNGAELPPGEGEGEGDPGEGEGEGEAGEGEGEGEAGEGEGEGDATEGEGEGHEGEADDDDDDEAPDCATGPGSLPIALAALLWLRRRQG